MYVKIKTFKNLDSLFCKFEIYIYGTARVIIGVYVIGMTTTVHNFL